MQRLIYIMDPMCSWCWGFAPVVEALLAQAAEYGVPLHVVVGGLRLDRAPLEQSVRSKIFEHWQNVEQTTGQPFDFTGALPEGFVYDTSLACQALVAARVLEPALVLPLAKRLQKAFYCDQNPLRDIAAIVQMAVEVGLDEERFASALDCASTEEATLADFAWASGLGIVGFPTLLAEHNGQLALLTNGYQPLPALRSLLARWLAQAARV